MRFSVIDKNERELWIKIDWFIKLRWIIFLIIAILIVLNEDFIGKPLIYIDTHPLLIIVGIIGVLNFLFHFLNFKFYKNISEKELLNGSVKKYLYLFFAQVFTDYLCVTILIAYYGFLNFNLSILYLPHILITSIIFKNPVISFSMMWLSLIVVYSLSAFHRKELDEIYHYISVKENIINGATIFALFNTGLFHFVKYLVNLMVGIIIKDRNELYSVNHQLHLMDKEKQNYTLRATHELKAPFAAIQSLVQTILAGYLGEINPKVREILVKIEIRCQTLSKMIKNIIQLSNLKTSIYKEDNFEEIKVVQLIMGRIENFSEISKSKKIALFLESYLPDEYTFSIITNLFEILIDNLISNALQYSKQDTKITIKVLGAENNNLIVSVKDQGIGIPAENIEKIFHEHFRCDNAASFNQTGNGMGLSIVKEIIRLHKASIKVLSELDKGTEFVLNFPFEH